MIADTLRLEEKNYRNIETLMQLLKASGPDATSQELYENAVEADRGIILLYKNLCEAWAEAQNLFRKADEAIKENKEESDKYHDELNEKIDEVNNYLNSLIRELQEEIDDIDLSDILERLTTAEGNITSLGNRMTTAEGNISNLNALINKITKRTDDTRSNVIAVNKNVVYPNGYTNLATVEEYSLTLNSYTTKDLKLPYLRLKEISDSDLSHYFNGSDWYKNPYELYYDITTGKYHPVYIRVEHVYLSTIDATHYRMSSVWDLTSLASGFVGPGKIIDYKCIGTFNATDYGEITARIGCTKFCGKEYASGTGRKVAIAGDAYSLIYHDTTENHYRLSMHFDLSEAVDIVNSDNTAYTLPTTGKFCHIAKIVDLGQEVTL